MEVRPDAALASACVRANSRNLAAWESFGSYIKKAGLRAFRDWPRSSIEWPSLSAVRPRPYSSEALDRAATAFFRSGASAIFALISCAMNKRWQDFLDWRAKLVWHHWRRNEMRPVAFGINLPHRVGRKMLEQIQIRSVLQRRLAEPGLFRMLRCRFVTHSYETPQSRESRFNALIATTAGKKIPHRICGKRLASGISLKFCSQSFQYAIAQRIGNPILDLCGLRRREGPWMKIGENENPFCPGFGEIPPELTGREEVKSEFISEMERLAAKRAAPRCILLIGPRGCGKTAMLSWLERTATNGGSVTVLRPPANELTGAETVVLALAHCLPSAGRKTGAVEFSLQASAAIGGGKFRWEGASGTEVDGARSFLRALASKKPLILIVDEAHELNPDAAGLLFDAFQNEANLNPMLLVLAGTPDTRPQLKRSRATFAERGKKFMIGRVDDEAAFQALAKPLQSRDIGYDGAALRRAADSAQNHPYFLQCWGAALWDAEAARQEASSRRRVLAWLRYLRPDRPRIGAETFKAAEEAASERCEHLYSERRAEFEGYGLNALVAELVLDRAAGAELRAAADKLVANLANRWRAGETPPRGLPAGSEELRGSAEQLLLHTGFVWEAGPERWEFDIHSLAQHIALAATRRIGDELIFSAPTSAIGKALGFICENNASRASAIGYLVETGLAANERRAGQILQPLENAGILGPSGEIGGDGKSLLSVHTPRFARKVLEYMEAKPRPALEPEEVDSPSPFD